MPGKLLSIQHVSVQFRTGNGVVRAVDDAALDVEEGQIAGLIGETGSGKSVLGLSIPRLLPSNAKVSGSILFKGEQLTGLDDEAMRRLRGREIAFIPQNPATSLNPVLRVGYQIAEAVQGLVSPKARRAKAAELLRRMDMPEPEEKLRKYPFELSGGMKQRILTAIGTAGTPSLLIADEPTKGLDALVRNQVIGLLHRAAKQTGAGMIVITHDLHVARALCDIIGVMYAGQLVELGPASLVLGDPKHPYTQGLLRSMPGAGMIPIPGSAPSLLEEQTGCSFYPRCTKRQAVCAVQKPPLQQADERTVRCIVS
ncbi:ABC transporter ATP-binding protein [Paenibacillus sp. y28]|uniref:ABC transporter ATP-binding protein n=1 Tax=Paenibacillus sp. y28 TaxID=3129110 RepID=UPI0030174181